MDWLQFNAAIIGHLAWPSVIVALLIVLRRHIGSLADRLIERSLPGTTFKFEKLLEKGAELIEHEPPRALPKPAEPELPLKFQRRHRERLSNRYAIILSKPSSIVANGADNAR